MTTTRYRELVNAGRQRKERADCAVISLAVATGLDYDTVHDALRAAGRQDRQKTMVMTVERAAKLLGFSVKRRKASGTMRTVMDQIRAGVPAVVFVTGHFAGFDGAEIHDWKDGKLTRIRLVIDIEKVVDTA